MPKSRVRRKTVYTPPPAPASETQKVSPRWLVPVMLTLFLIGIAWLVVFYATNGEAPVQDSLGNWNLVVGFGSIIVGFGLSTQWR